MKTAVAGALALLLGLFLGGLGPRSELRRAHEELAEAKRQAKEAAERAGAGSMLPLALGGLQGVLGGQGRESSERAGSVPRFVVPPGGDGTQRQAASEERAGDGRDRERRRRRGDDWSALLSTKSEEFEAAKAAMAMKAALVRGAFFEEARLGPEQRATVDQTIKTMNDQLGRVAEELVDAAMKENGKPSNRALADMGAKFLDAYRGADDQLKAGLDPTALAAMKKTDFDLLTQLDLGAFRSAAEKFRSIDRDRSRVQAQ